jgi:hypothetical protein
MGAIRCDTDIDIRYATTDASENPDPGLVLVVLGGLNATTTQGSWRI